MSLDQPKFQFAQSKFQFAQDFFLVWYTFSGKISVCSRFSRELGSPGSGYLEAWFSDKI